MKLISALAGGLAGACAMTLLHEIIKKVDKDAPRLDLLGMEALKKETTNLNFETPPPDKLFMGALTGDIAGNTLYYSLAGLGRKNTTIKGTLMGIAAGLGAIYLPERLGLNKKYSGKTDKRKALTTLYYAIGGLVASSVMKLIDNKFDRDAQDDTVDSPRLTF